MTVVKRSGKHEEYSTNKLANSIRSANEGTGEPLKVTFLLSEFEQIVKGKELISTQQIDIIIYGLLYSKGLLQTLDNYISYDKLQ